MNKLTMEEFSDFLKNGIIPKDASEDDTVSLFDEDRVLQKVLVPIEVSNVLVDALLKDVNDTWDDSIKVETNAVNPEDHPDVSQVKCLMNLSMDDPPSEMMDDFQKIYSEALKFPIELGLFEGHLGFTAIAPYSFRTGWDQDQEKKIKPIHVQNNCLYYGMEFDVNSQYAGTDLMLSFLKKIMSSDEVDRISDTGFMKGYNSKGKDVLDKYKHYRWIMTREHYDFIREEYYDRYGIQEFWKSAKDASFYGFKVILSTVSSESLSDEQYYPMIFMNIRSISFYYSRNFTCSRFEKVEHGKDTVGLILYGEAGYRIHKPETVHVAAL